MAERLDGHDQSGHDNFAPFQRANPWLRDSGRVMGATHSQGVWVFNPRRPNAASFPVQRR
ncbi:hypothetical protein IQ279_08185 [Streptomyces verrucosisporus]|uniref:hypothetical protein n=1 Tax=Streptomyces verrucosisporus TaxID=1695161 RepID=UPI0019D12122|nr:hypothetical protein [Streptomyces verrucosisporus]MBN3929618.1 hypothetical protein [Streptomyces verrucosisporus]